MILSGEEFIRLRHSDDRNDYLRAANEDADTGVWEDILSSHPELAFWVAQNKTIPESILRRLSTWEDESVRGMIARKNSTPADVLANLAKDSSVSVRIAVASNKRTPFDVICQLTSDSWDGVREAATKRNRM
jgi:hypothetical protein